MNTLTIKDLAVSCELDGDAMARVRGGYKAQPSYALSQMHGYSPSHGPSYTSTIDATQNLQQFQNVNNLTANGSAFIDGVTATNTTSQFGQNNIGVVH